MSPECRKEGNMNIENLFNSHESKQKTKEEKKKLLSLVSYLNTKPLVYGMEKLIVDHNFILQKDVPSVCASRLVEGEVDIGIIPSIEYANSRGNWRIIPDIALVSRQAVRSVCLFFKKDIKDIKTVALDTSSRTSSALLKILLQEKYELIPNYIVMAPDLKEMLKKADAALVIGDKALHYNADYPHLLDLGEEWYSLTGLPFVYAFWAGHELAISGKDVQAITESKQLGVQKIDEIARDYARNHPRNEEFYYNYLTKNIFYEFADEEKEGLSEFYKYAFYFGLIDYIPELHFYER
jgi:chorismate dehydratase